MVRLARTVFPDLPHHVVQRGNRAGQVFFCDDDRRAYLDWLREYCVAQQVQVLAYCLMDNHVHLVAVPPAASSLECVFRPLHMRYAQRINLLKGWKGHLWQGRFFSSPLDEPYLWNAIRYVERNPLRAGMVERCEDYRWSSAAAHCELRADPLLVSDGNWREVLDEVADWSEWLAESEALSARDALRRNLRQNWPCGSDRFVADLECRTGKPLSPRPLGRRKELGKELGTHPN